MSAKTVIVKTTLNLPPISYPGERRKCPVELSLELQQGTPTAPRLSIDGQPVHTLVELSICGGIWMPDRRDMYEAGQCIDSIAGHYPDDKRVQRIREIWERWHLNGIQAGTRRQIEALEAWKRAGGKTDPMGGYESHLAALDAVGLKVDDVTMPGGRPYTYGHAWLCEPLPDDVIAEVCGLFGVNVPAPLQPATA